MANKRLSKDDLNEVVDGVMKSGLINKDMTVKELMEVTSRLENDTTVAWTAVLDGDKYFMFMA